MKETNKESASTEVLQPHDKYIKALLRLRRTALELIDYGVPAPVKAILDAKTLKQSPDSFVDDKLKEHLADFVYECQTAGGLDVRICFLVEHKSQKQAIPVAFQLLRYLLSILESDFLKKRSYSVCIPIVLYHGKESWDKETIASLFPRIPAYLQAYLPDFDYVFINLKEKTDEHLFSLEYGIIRQMFLFLKHAREESFVSHYFAELVIFAGQNTDGGEFRFFYAVTVSYIKATTSFNKKNLRLMFLTC